MTAVVIALSVFGLAAVGGIVLLAVKLSAALDNERTSLAGEALANRAQLQAEAERDQAVVQYAQARAEAIAATAQLVATQKAANDASAEEVTRVRTQVASGSAADAVRVLDGLLAAELPGVASAAVEPAAGGQRDAVAPAVQPAAVAAPGDVRRGS